LPVEFGEFTSAKGLGKCRESLEEITQPPVHSEAISDLVRDVKF